MKDFVECDAGSTLWLTLKVKVSFDRNVKFSRSDLKNIIENEVSRYLQELKDNESN